MTTRKWGREKLVNTTTSGNQIASDIAVLADGSFVIVWQDDSGPFSAIRAQRYDAAGNRLGPEVAIATSAEYDEVSPSVTALADGGFYVTWTQPIENLDNYILGVVYDANGEFVRSQHVVFDSEQVNDSQVAKLGTGSAVAWYDPFTSDIYFRIFDAAGNGGALLLANTTNVGLQHQPAIAASSDQTKLAIVWVDSNDSSIQGQLFDAAGNQFGPQFRIDAPAGHPAAFGYYPVVTWLNNAQYVVVWTQLNSENNTGYEIKARIFDGQSSTPMAVTGNIAVNSTTSGNQQKATVTALPDGGFVVAWEDPSGIGIDGSVAIRLQGFDAAGNKIGGEIVVNTTTTGNQSAPSVEALPDGRVVVSWTDASQSGGDTSGNAIRMQIVDPRDGIVTGTPAGETLYGHDSVNDEISAGAGDDTLSGLRGDDALYGGEGNDLLNGGIGADIMYGGTGNDTYVVDNAGDDVIEDPGEGTDLVQSSITYALGADVENLTQTGTAAINGTGNALANTIIGNSANNILNGGDGSDTLNGGLGADAMTGGSGNDIYVVENAGDSAVEAAGGGIDTVKSSITDTLDAQVEKLTLTGAAAINGTGNALANTITGNSANNVLKGGNGNDTLNGAAGNDDLFGNAGLDSFLFNTALNAATNVDDIFDFSSIDDKVLLENAVFTTVGAPGTLASTAFFIGAAAHDGDDRIIYNSASGTLRYDSDGTGAAAATQFATLSTGLALANTNFKIV